MRDQVREQDGGFITWKEQVSTAGSKQERAKGDGQDDRYEAGFLVFE